MSHNSPLTLARLQAVLCCFPKTRTDNPLTRARCVNAGNISAVVSVPIPTRTTLLSIHIARKVPIRGKKQNKTSSAVQLKHLPTGIVVKSQATRSRSQNRKIARRILAEKLEFMERGPESRLGALAERDRKKKASKSKKAKRKCVSLPLPSPLSLLFCVCFALRRPQGG